MKNVSDIAAWRLCLGCGACAYICPEKKVNLVDFIEEGIRPVLKSDPCGSCFACLDVCPGYENDHTEINRRSGIIPELAASCGPVLEIWEGHAADPEIRFLGSSGGAITALSLHCLEKEGMSGVLHVGGDPDHPVRNKTQMSRSRADLLKKTGSRYAPASACDRLDLIESAPGPCVFIGQPSEATALAKAQNLRPALKEKVGLVISFFCAGSPSTKGTLDLLQKMNIAPARVGELRYRGNGWPGHFAPTLDGQSQPASRMTYKESWGFLQAYRPYSTHVCPDGTGEDADVSCGDPWHREIAPDEPGLSMVVVRTERGRQIVRRAVESGALKLWPSDSEKLLASQRNLMNKRRAIWGRLLAFRLMGLPTPRLKGFSLFQGWLKLSFKEKLRSIFGSWRRIIQRNYRRPLDLTLR